mmetsp:Transcript_20161/g.28355  ORF Transcript_20161/g.28355 Transcript_20161/m.28355 type:complete len:542 (-) Transcript_20161:5-1630(-)
MNPDETRKFWSKILKGENKETAVTSTINSKNTRHKLHEVSKEIIESTLFENSGVHFFNNAGASPSPPEVYREIATHLALEARVGGYAAAQHVQDKLNQVYVDAARLINAEKASEIALVESATVGWTRIFYSMANHCIHNERMKTEIGQKRKKCSKTFYILVSEAEYAANIVAIVQFAREQNSRNNLIKWSVVAIPSENVVGQDSKINTTNCGCIDLNAFASILSGTWTITAGDVISDIENTTCTNNNGNDTECTIHPHILDPSAIAMVCITHIPTNSGIINPVEEIGKQILEFNINASMAKKDLSPILYIVDACQSVGQITINVQDMHAHALTATGRKYLRGPRGTGFLYVRQDICNRIMPSHIDHYGAPISPKCCDGESNAPTKSKIQFTYCKGARRFEFWESNISCRLGLGAAISYALDTVGIDKIESRIMCLSEDLRQCLRMIKEVKIHHDSLIRKSCGIVTFAINGIDSELVQVQLLLKNEQQFEVSVVPRSSTPIDSRITHVGDLVRVSLSYINTTHEIQSFCKRLECIIKKFKKR